jgi:hypothetical protein
VPYGWFNPEVYMQHGWVTVYRIYKNDELEAGVRRHWFTTDMRGGDEHAHGESGAFHVYELNAREGMPLCGDDENEIQAIIRKAIDSGELPIIDPDLETD